MRGKDLELFLKSTASPEEYKKKFPEEFEKLKEMEKGIEEEDREKVKEIYMNLAKSEDNSFVDAEFARNLINKAWEFLTKGLSKKKREKLRDEMK